MSSMTPKHEDFASPYRVIAELRLISALLMGILTMLLWIAHFHWIFVALAVAGALVLFFQSCVIERAANLVEGREPYLLFRKQNGNGAQK
jgi:hypothetical protein